MGDVSDSTFFVDENHLLSQRTKLAGHWAFYTGRSDKYLKNGQHRCPEYQNIQKHYYTAYEFLINGKYFAFEISTTAEHKNVLDAIVSTITFLN
jgi:hypothetical protein